jgi:hypothetical protein
LRKLRIQKKQYSRIEKIFISTKEEKSPMKNQYRPDPLMLKAKSTFIENS